MDVAAAISDPVRRQIMTLLKDRSMTAGTIAARFEISRPAVSRHLRVLRECGLVVGAASGRQRVYELDTGPLDALDAWLNQFRDPWPGRLDALGTEVYRTRRDRRTITPSNETTHKEHTA